ncbi:MAG TPA: hypothetical protein VHK66_00720 [Microvirga sp.]|nr:hypothetical protein [Microvirga sp.]
MTRNALTSLDFETREAAEAAARRSGLSLDEWVAAAIIEQGRTSSQVKRSRARQGDLDAALAKIARVTRHRASVDFDPLAATAPEAPDPSGRTALALDSVADWIEQAEARLSESAHGATEQQERLASALADALEALQVRLDRVESRIAGPSTDLADALSAVRGDFAALTSRLERQHTPPDPWHAALQGIEREVGRLRASFGNLVTREEVATLEDLVRGLAADLAQPDSSADITALAQSVSQVQAQVRHLAEEVSQDLHRRITAEVEGLARKLDQVAAAGAGRAGVEALGHQIADMRQALARMADPQLIERLAGEVAALGRQVAEMRAQQVAPGEFASLKEALEDIRVALQRSEEAQETSEVPGQLQNLNRRLDLLMSRPDPVGLDPITAHLATLTEQISALASSLSAERTEPPHALASGMESLRGRIDALAEKIDASPKPVLGRLDRLETSLREASAAPGAVFGRIDKLEDTIRQIGEQADTAPIEIMVRGLVEKLELGQTGGANLDGLEQRLEVLARQLTRSASEQVQQALTETLTHVKTLRGEAAIIAERAAKAAIREAQAASPADSEAVKQGFAELRALQADAEKRTQATLKAVHNALETLMLRPPAAPAAGPSAAAPADALPAVRLEAAVRKLHAAALSQPDPLPQAPIPVLEPAAPEPEEVLIEPGAPRGGPGASFIAPQDGEPGHARANFIAAARRAAQAASAEAGARADEAEPPAETDPPISNQTLIERIRQTFESHRRPLLLSMALLVVVAGSMQAITRLGGSQAPTPAPSEGSAKTGVHAPAPIQPKPGTAPIKAASAPALHASAPIKADSAPSPSANAPSAIANVPPAAEPPKGQLPGRASGEPSGEAPLDLFDPVHVSSLAPAPVRRVQGIVPADLPAGAPSTLVRAAESGDGAAVYELASRLAEGRTMPREPALAAKLFEKAAQAGIAPAQFRLGNMYEKGVGVARDLGLARSLYEQAAVSGNTRAMHNLAVLLAEGASGQPDYAKAGRWFQEAAELGVRDSQYNLAVLLARGLGMPQDLVQSYKWFALAAGQGDEEAGRKRDEIGARLPPETVAAAQALAARWKARPAVQSANEVALPLAGWSAARTASRRG